MTYSVFIPRIFANISEARIIQIFHNLSIGEVDHVDLLRKTGNNGQPYNMGFVHFKQLYDSPNGGSFRADVENAENKTKIVYDDPWFWIVLPFEQKEQKEPQQQEQQPQEQFTQQQQQFIQQPQQFTPQHIPNQGMWMMTEFGMQWCWYYPTMVGANGVMNHMLPPHHAEIGYDSHRQYDNRRMPKNRQHGNNRNNKNNRKRLGRENAQSEPKVSDRNNDVNEHLEEGEIDEADSMS